MLPRIASWASLRTLIVAAGFPFVALSIGSACLDYAGEDWGMGVCDTPAGSASARFGVGSGSGSGSIIPVDAGPDCSAASTGSDAGSDAAAAP